MPLDGRQNAGGGQAERLRPRAAQHQERVGAGARHDTVEQPERIGDQACGQILLERERLFHQGMRKRQRIGALGDTQFAEVLGRGAIGPHVIGSEESEARVGSTRAIRIDRIAGKLAEGRQVKTERVGVVGIARDAGDDVRVAALHGARGAAQRHDPARAAHRDMVEPAQGQAEVLREADCGVRRHREA